MSEDTIKREDAIRVVDHNAPYLSTRDLVNRLYQIPSADRPKHYCAECKYELLDKRCMPCSSCTNNPKNRDVFVSCEVEKKGADDEVR